MGLGYNPKRLQRHFVNIRDIIYRMEYIDSDNNPAKAPDLELGSIEFENLKTPSDLLAFMDGIEYGFVGNDGEKYSEQDERFRDSWYPKCIVQSGDELLESRCGTCWDQVELERKWFKEHAYQFVTIFSWFEVKKPNNYPNHTFLAFNDNEKWYWFEHAYSGNRGIHEFAALDDLVNEVKTRLLEDAIDSGVANPEDDSSINTCPYDEPPRNLDVDGYIRHVSCKND